LFCPQRNWPFNPTFLIGNSEWNKEEKPLTFGPTNSGFTHTQLGKGLSWNGSPNLRRMKNFGIMPKIMGRSSILIDEELEKRVLIPSP